MADERAIRAVQAEPVEGLLSQGAFVRGKQHFDTLGANGPGVCSYAVLQGNLAACVRGGSRPITFPKGLGAEQVREDEANQSPPARYFRQLSNPPRRTTPT